MEMTETIPQIAEKVSIIPMESVMEEDEYVSDSADTVKIPALDKYNLRVRSIQNRIETEKRKKEPKKPKPKQKPPPLSKYRRKTANLRERCRMQEMNLAFEQLRKAVPEFPTEDTEEEKNNSKLTKITTLRLAVNYIKALTEILKDSEGEDNANTKTTEDKCNNSVNSEKTSDLFSMVSCADVTSLLTGLPFDDSLLMHRPSSCGSSDLPSCGSPSTTETESLQSLESLKSSCWPDFSADDSLEEAFDLILESDGEGMQFSDDLIS